MLAILIKIIIMITITESIHTQSPPCGSVEMNLTRNHEVVCSISGVAQWVKDPACPELRRRSQMWLISGIAVDMV